MDKMAQVTVMVENSVLGRGLLAEHGLAYWIEIGGQRVLFDTGQGAVLVGNARKLDVPLELADSVVLSHGHFDHTGGLVEVLQAAPRINVYAHPAAFGSKYIRREDGTINEIGIPPPCAEIVGERIGKPVPTEHPTEVAPGLFATGTIPRRTDYEDTSGQFFTDPECRHADPLLDDQALFFESPSGTVVLLGCAHAGIVNTIETIQELTGGKPIHAVMGGTHLITASQTRIGKTIDALGRIGMDRFGPAHCTGLAALVELWKAFPEQCFPCSVGTKLEFG